MNNTKKALILHSWYGNPEGDWYPWLKTELENRGYQVFIPILPTMDTDLPDMDLQIKAIKETLMVDQETLIIGHSLGSVLALRLAEIMPVGKLILVACWDFNDLTSGHESYWSNLINHQKIKSNVKEIVCISSDNDPYITGLQSEEMSKRFNEKYILIKGAGHFSKDRDNISQIPEILDFI